LKKGYSIKVRRTFSESLKKKIVRDIEKGKAGVRAVSREYDVSITSVYSWIKKYCRHLQSGETIVMQMDSESYKTKALEKRIVELEAALGRKQLEVDFLDQLLNQGKEQLGIDLKKKFSIVPSTGSEITRQQEGTK